MFQKIAKHRANDAYLTMHRPPLHGRLDLSPRLSIGKWWKTTLNVHPNKKHIEFNMKDICVVLANYSNSLKAPHLSVVIKTSNRGKIMETIFFIWMPLICKTLRYISDGFSLSRFGADHAEVSLWKLRAKDPMQAMMEAQL